jgi:4'-phosphopantetheinyl transferase
MIRIFAYKNKRLSEIELRHLALFLSDYEVEKALRLKEKSRKEQAILGRYLVRRKLAAIFKIHPKKVVISDDSFGRPRLEYPKRDNFDFNISHSGEWIVFAISTSGPVGIDIEKNDPLNLQIMKVILNNKDIDFIDSASSEKDSLKRFYVIWTLKEAFVKASGCVQYPLKKLVFDVSKKGSVGLSKECSSEKWNFKTYNIDPGYQMAVCASSVIESNVNFIRKLV